MITASQLAAFDQHGFLVAKKIIGDPMVIADMRGAYTRLFAALIDRIASADGRSALNRLANTERLPDMVAGLLGVAGKKAMDHLDPVLNSQFAGYSFDDTLPSAQLRELFNLGWNQDLLDAVEKFTGPEMCAHLGSHFYFKLDEQRQDLAYRLQESASKPCDFEDPILWEHHVGSGQWTANSLWGLPYYQNAAVVTAWVPLTPMRKPNGGLGVIPGSHRIHSRRLPHNDELRSLIYVEADPGDVVFLHHNTFYTSHPNVESDAFSWAVGLRFSPANSNNPEPMWPRMLIRSADHANAISDYETWQNIVRRALRRFSDEQVPRSLADLSPHDQIELVRRHDASVITRAMAGQELAELSMPAWRARCKLRTQSIWRRPHRR